MSELPEGWARAVFADVADIKLGKMLDKAKNKGVAAPYLRNVNVRWGSFDIDDLSEMRVTVEDRAALSIRDGDLMICEGGEPGRSAVWSGGPTDLVFQKALMRARTKGGTSARYLAAHLKQTASIGQLDSYFTGTTIKHLPQAALARVSLPLPPVPEQRRIVAKIDRLSARSKRAREELERISNLQGGYRGAILSAAFSGVLTRDWRATSGHHDEDPDHRPNELDLDDRERGKWRLQILPASWRWRAFDDVFADVTDTTRKLPQRDYLAAGRFPVVDQGEMLIGGWSDNADLVQQSSPPFIVFGDHTRCIKLIRDVFVQGADGVKVLKQRDGYDINFLYWALKAVELPNKGYSRHMKFLKATVFPWCPLPEQHEIVRRIEHAFEAIDRLAAEATSAQKLLDRLDQAVLAKAFRGELVPQDPNDEPASVLLERIRAERAAAPASKRGRKPKTIKA